MASNNPLPPLKGVAATYRSLHNRNFRLYFGGQSISLIGTWMQRVAVSWLTYRLTRSAFLLGLVGFAGQIPIFLLTPFAGVLVDRWDRHRILVVTQILSLIQALTLAFLVLTNTIAIWHVILLSILLGLINVFDNPTRLSFIVDMVDNKEDLGNAIALNASMFHGASLVGPAIAGILIAIVGEGICFLLNGLSFIGVIISLLAMKITPKLRGKNFPPVWQGLKEGFIYTFGFPPIRSLILLLAWTNLIGISYTVLMPVFANVILHGGAHTFGFLLAASGCGAMSGSIFLASRRSVLGLLKIIAINSILFGIGLVLFSLSQIFWLSILLLAITGFGMVLLLAGANTALQTMVDEDKRGRVMSFFIIANVGMLPFGNLLAGSLAHLIGAPKTILIGGILCILGSIMYAIKLPSMRALIRPIYIRKGIILEEQAGN